MGVTRASIYWHPMPKMLLFLGGLSKYAKKKHGEKEDEAFDRPFLEICNIRVSENCIAKRVVIGNEKFKITSFYKIIQMLPSILIKN